jgi:tetratricopeptide (TPR) repeat protein
LSKASQIRQKAQEYLSKGQIDKAIQEYRRLLSLESKNPNLYNELGDIFLRGGDKAQAVQNFEKAATIYEQVALYNNAVAVCKKVLRVEPEKTDTIFRLAELRAKQKLEGEAITFFSQYVECVLANPQSLLQRAQRDAERILELMPLNEAIVAKAIEIYEQLGLKLKTAELCDRLSSSAREKGDSKRQILYLRKAEELRSNLTPEELETLDEAGSGEEEAPAASAGSGGQAPGAAASPPEKTLEEGDGGGVQPAARTQPPRAEDTSEEIGEGPSRSSEPDEHGTDPGTRETGEEAEMVAAMSGYQATDVPGPGFGGDPKRARRKASPVAGVEAKRATPTSDKAQTASPAPFADEVEGKADETERGVDAKSATDLAGEITSDVEKNDLRSHYDLGMAYLEMGLYTEAIKDFQIASRCVEFQLSSMEMIGYCFLKNDEPRLAVKQLTHALEIAEKTGAESLGIHYNLGLAHEMLGELGPAKEHFEEVYIMDMAFRDVSEKMKKLGSNS